MIAAGIRPGDEVITTPFSFVASANCIVYVGARPVFVDIDPKTLNIDLSKVAELRPCLVLSVSTDPQDRAANGIQ